MLAKICAQELTFFWSQDLAHLWVGSHDCVIPVIIQGGGHGVQRAGPIRFSLHPVVFTPFRDLLPIFEPIDLYGKNISHEEVDVVIISPLEEQ